MVWADTGRTARAKPAARAVITNSRRVKVVFGSKLRTSSSITFLLCSVLHHTSPLPSSQGASVDSAIKEEDNSLKSGKGKQHVVIAGTRSRTIGQAQL